MTGTLTYSGVVLIVNAKMLFSTNNHTIPSFLIVFFSVVSFYLYFKFESSFTFFPELYTIFGFISKLSMLFFYIMFIILCTLILEKVLEVIPEMFEAAKKE